MIRPKAPETCPSVVCRSSEPQDFDLLYAIVLADERRNYGEVRYRAFGRLDDRLHVLVFTQTARGIRVISLRRANKREVKRYGTQAQSKSSTPGRG